MGPQIKDRRDPIKRLFIDILNFIFVCLVTYEFCITNVNNLIRCPADLLLGLHRLLQMLLNESPTKVLSDFTVYC